MISRKRFLKTVKEKVREDGSKNLSQWNDNLKGKFKEEVYNSKSAKLDMEMVDVDREVTKHKGADRQYHKEIEGFLIFCKEAPALFRNSKPALK